MYELGQNIFWAILIELFFVILAVILKGDTKDGKRRMIIVLVVGTSLAGIVGFWRLPSISSANSPSNSSTASDDTSSNYLALQSALNLITTSNGGIYCQDVSLISCAKYSYGEATIYNNSPYDLTLRNDEGCYFDFREPKSKQWYLYSSDQVTVICPLIYNSEEKLYDIEILFLYPQSGPNQAGESIVISFQVK